MAFALDWIGVGGIAMDLLLQVHRLPLSDDKYPAELLGRLPGGFIANATCAAARLGLRAGYVGWVGDDADGALLAEDFAGWGVNAAGLMHVPGEVTPFTLVITDTRGGRAIVLPDSPLYHRELTYEQLTLVSTAQVVYSYPRDTTWCGQLRRAAIEGGGLLALDVERAVPLRGQALRDAARLADILFVSGESLKGLGAKSLRDLAEGRQWVIQTAGAHGAYGLAAGMKKPVHVPARKVPVVDTTGAGDTFHAAAIVARLQGATLPEALAFGAAAAAIKVGHRGARGGLPTRAEVERLLR